MKNRETCVLPLTPGNPQPCIPASAPPSVKLTPGRTGKGGHREFTLAFTSGVRQYRVFPNKLGAVCLRKKGLKNCKDNK
jgi:hypothetical protein